MRFLSCAFFVSVFSVSGVLPGHSEEVIRIPNLKMSDLKMPTHPQDINCYIPKNESGQALDLHDQLEIVEVIKDDGTTEDHFVCFEKTVDGEPDIEAFKRSIRSSRLQMTRHHVP